MPPSIANLYDSQSHLARLESAPMPRLVPARMVTFLKQAVGGEYPLARIRAEQELLNEIDADVSTVDDRIFKFTQLLQELHTNAGADATVLALGAGRSTPTPFGEKSDLVIRRTPIEDTHADEIVEVKDRLAFERGKRADLNGRGRPISDRLATMKRHLTNALTGTPIKFRRLPSVDGRTNLEQLRAQIGELKAEIVEAEGAPLPLSVAKKRLEDWVDGRVRPLNVLNLFEPKTPDPVIPMVLLPAANGGHVEAPDAFGENLARNRDSFLKYYFEILERNARDDEALDFSERAEKVAALKAQMLEFGRVEEAICWQKLRAGEAVMLRADADARAILSCE